MLSPVVRYGHLSCHWDVRPCSDWEDHIEPFPVACLQDNSLDVSSLVLIPSREARNVDWFEPNTRHAGKSRNLIYESDVHALTPVICLLSGFISDVFLTSKPWCCFPRKPRDLEMIDSVFLSHLRTLSCVLCASTPSRCHHLKRVIHKPLHETI